MMETKDMFPEGHHPHEFSYRAPYYGPMRTPDLTRRAKFFTRTQRPPKYYIIDFGISSQYDNSEVSREQLPIFGGDDTVPEFKDYTQPRNTYWTDVYYAGNLVREHFTEVRLLYHFDKCNLR